MPRCGTGTLERWFQHSRPTSQTIEYLEFYFNAYFSNVFSVVSCYESTHIAALHNNDTDKIKTYVKPVHMGIYISWTVII